MADLPKILICEDDLDIQQMLKSYLVEKCNYDVRFCSSGEEFLDQLNRFYTVLLVDVMLPGIDGVDVLKTSKEKLPNTPVIMMTAHSSENLVLSCMRQGAYNYIRKPFNLGSLNTSILEAHGEYNLRNKKSGSEVVNKLETKSEKVKELHTQIDKLAKKDISILFNGETGTGKEYYARILHETRDKRSRFIAVNCPAIPKDLAESELFGHEKGSFTGADSQRIGKLEMSDGGVLFLDEIADLDMNVQNKLLRCLQERSFYRVGGTEEIAFNTLVVSATSKNLKKLIAENRFREDLYYRIADVELNIVPLRKRTEDMETLVSLFCDEYARQNNEKAKVMSEEVLKALKKYQWPGNLRELRSTIRKISILSDQNIISLSDLPENILNSKMNIDDREDKVQPIELKDHEKELIEKALIDCRFNLSKAAKQLGIGRSTLYRKIKKFNIQLD